MPHHSQRRHRSHATSHRRAKPNSIWSATMKKNSFHVLKHKHRSMGKKASMKNIRYALRNILPNKVNEMNTSAVRQMRESLNRAAKSTQRLIKMEDELRKAREKMEKQRKKNELEAQRAERAARAALAQAEKQRKRNELNAKRAAKAAQAASIHNMENIFAKMQF